ncbi:MAG: hypothetical protein K2J20_00075 [Bacilli bacterium]|nr:hypothetical protein [Bacilli bacterium]
MLQKIGLFLILCLIITPKMVWAEANYQSMNLDEALIQEKIEHDFSNYKESDDQITIYLFRGNGCGFCQNFLSFLNSIIDDYGKYFKVESYEVWENPNNRELMKEVTKFLDYDGAGIPFIIIGDKVFNGYIDAYAEDIKQAITNLYNSENRYDVMEEMSKPVVEEKVEVVTQKVSILPIILWSGGFTLVSTGAIIFYSMMQNKRLMKELESIKDLVKERKKK